jgi:hypothetical protein
MSTQLKSFSDLGSLYESAIFLTESKKEDDLGFKKAGAQKKDGPEAADGFDKKKLNEKKTPAGDAKKAGKVKEVKESVQPSKQSTSMKQSAFDRLYEQAMNEGPDNVTQPVVDDQIPTDAAPVGDEPAVDDIPGDDVGGEEEIDPKAVFGEICALVDKLKKFYGVEDDLGADVPGDGVDDVPGDADIEDLSKESVEAPELPSSKGQSLTAKGNNVGGVKVVKKKADNGGSKEDPEAKPLGDKGSSLTGKNNKVGGSGAQSKVGASALE